MSIIVGLNRETQAVFDLTPNSMQPTGQRIGKVVPLAEGFRLGIPQFDNTTDQIFADGITRVFGFLGYLSNTDFIAARHRLITFTNATSFTPLIPR